MTDTSPIQRLTAANQSVISALDKLIEVGLASGQPHLADEVAKDKARIGGGIRIAVVGAFSSGKSTFVNAILGEKLLPVRVEPTTATVTELRNGKRRVASVTLKTAEVIREERDQARARKEALEAQEQLSGAEREELNSLAAVIDLDPEFRYPGGLPEAFLLDDDKQRETLYRFLAEGAESWAPYTERVRIEIPMDSDLMPPQVVLVDTPGSNTPSALHRTATWRALIESDCVIFLLFARQPLSSTDRELLNDIQQIRLRQRIEQDRFIFVVNGIDEVDGDTGEREAVMQHVLRQLQGCGVQDPKVVPASALLAFIAKTHQAGQPITKKERRLLWDETNDQPERGWNASDVGTVLDLLWKTVGKEVATHLLSEALTRADSRHRQVQQETEDQFQKVAQKLEAVEGEARGVEQILTRKRRHRPAVENKVRIIVEQALRGLDDTGDLQHELVGWVKAQPKEQDLSAALTTAARRWLHGRIQLIGERVAACGVQIQQVVAEAVDDEEAVRAYAPRIQPPAFNIRFDLKPIVEPSSDQIGAATSAGALLGGALFLILTGGWGWALLGGGLGALLSGSAMVKKAKEKVAELLKLRQREVGRKAAELQVPLQHYLQRSTEVLVEWAGEHFEGRLNDIEARFNKRIELAREHARDAEATKRRLEMQIASIEECRALLTDAHVRVKELKG